MKILLPLLLFIFFPLAAYAAQYSVWPLVVDHELQKRDIVTETITLTNNDDRMVRIYPTVNEITLGEEGAIEEFVAPSMSDRASSVTSWLSITRGRIELAPGESRELTLTIKVNPDVVPGEYHAFVGFPEGSNRPDAQQRVQEENVPGTVVRIGVDTEQSQYLRLEKYTVERFVRDAAQKPITYVLSNTGEDTVIPQGEIIFYNTTGVEVGAVPINEDKTPIEPGDSATFTQNIPDDLRMGKYKAFLSVEYGEHQTESIHDTAFFYVMPLMYILLIFAAVLISAIVLALYLHRRLGVEDVSYGADEVALFIRQGRSESQEHDIDLSKKHNE